MKRCFLIPFILATAFMPGVAAANPPPPTVPGGFEPGADLRLFLNHEDLSYFAEFAGINQTDNRQLREVTLGTYYRVLENLKLGVFYRKAWGLRHEEDWMQDSGGNWFWQNTNRRSEDFAIGDITPVASLDFLPGKNWVGELKTRYLYDFFDGQQTLVVRPGLRYFWLKNDQPFMNFFLQFEGDFPLNYSMTTLNQEWIYLGALYHLKTGLDLGGFTAVEWEKWGSPASFIGSGGQPYTVTAQTWILGAIAIFQFDI